MSTVLTNIVKCKGYNLGCGGQRIRDAATARL